MDYFEAQETAKRRTGLLVALFLAAVVGIVLVIYGVVHVALGPGPGPIDPLLLGQVALGVALLVSIGSAVRIASLRGGGPAVAELLGGRRVAPDTTDAHERRLINVVEEMALASGMPVPAVYVVDREDSLNAFAAGYTANDAAVAVTRGSLRGFTRDELQGVIAHEFSHILNGDMRLNVRLIGVLYGILLLTIIGRGILYVGPRGRGGGGRDGAAGAIMLIALALLLVGYIGVFFGKLIKAAVSRQREYLADSAAVEFTRNPDGLASALKKIASAATGSRIANPHAEELSHLFFANGLKSSIFGMLSTHPPIDERIRRLDPNWAGAGNGSGATGRMADVAGVSGLAAPAAAPPASPRESRSPRDRAPDRVVATVGSPTRTNLELADTLLASMPDELNRAVHQTDGAVAMVFALIASTGDSAGAVRVAEAARAFGGAALENRLLELTPAVKSYGTGKRLVLLELLLPAVGTMSPGDAGRFLDAVEAAIEADDQVKVFEVALRHVLARKLAGPDSWDRRARTINSFEPLRRETGTILSALAWVGARSDRRAAERAFGAGAALLPDAAGHPALMELASVSAGQLDRSLTAFQHAAPSIRRDLLRACAECAAHDDRIDPTEMEVLAAVSAAMDCPMPIPI